jgi:hypothetical protein
MRLVKKMKTDQIPQTARVQLALEQSALHAAMMALTRWTSGNTHAELQLADALRPTSQARWHNAAQRNFKAWLDAGGFAGNADAPAAKAEPVQLERPAAAELQLQLQRTHLNYQ